jgi:hypothetical protein
VVGAAAAPRRAHHRRVRGDHGDRVGVRLTLSGGGTVRVGPPSLEEQIAELKQEIARTNARVNVVDQRTQDDVRDLRTALAGERAAREASTRTLAEQVQSYTVGGIVWEVVGAWWVVVGQLFGAFPDEIAKVIPKLLSWV